MKPIFLLIIPRTFDSRDMPLGFMYISAVLKQAGYEVYGLNLPGIQGEAKALIETAIIRYRPDVVATTSGAINMPEVREIFSVAKEILPTIKTIAGGALPTAEPELMLRDVFTDIVVIGEGELTILELAQALTDGHSIAAIHGIGYLDNGKYCQTPPRQPIMDLDSLPFPDLETFNVIDVLDLSHPMDMYLLDIEDNPRPIQIISSRGCPNSCTFCGHTLPKKIRYRSLDNVFAEIDLRVKECRPNIIAFCDEMLTDDKARLLELCQRIKPYGLHWFTTIRADIIDEEVAGAMVDSGCFLTYIGVDSADETVLRSMKKGTTVDRITRTIDILKKYQHGIQGNLLFGDSAETESTAINSLNWWLNNKFFFLFLRVVLPFPGSEVYRKALQAGKIPDKVKFLEQRCHQVNLTNMPDDQLIEINRTLGNMADFHKPVGMVTAEYQDTHPIKGRRFTANLTCGTCGKATVYRNLNPDGITWFRATNPDYARVNCRKCHMPNYFPLSVFDNELT